MFTVGDLIWYFTETSGQIVVWDNNTTQSIFRGEMDDVPDKMKWLEIQSIDPIENNLLVVNVDIESEDEWYYD